MYFVSPNNKQLILRITKSLEYSQLQLVEVLNKSQLLANLRGFCLTTNIPKNYIFVFTLSNLYDYSPLLYKEKHVKHQKKVSFNKEKEFRQIYQNHLGDKYF